MAENSKIECTDHTFNPWIGCTKVSPACDGCYAENLMDKRYGRVTWGAGEDRVRTAPANWRNTARFTLYVTSGYTAWSIRDGGQPTVSSSLRSATGS